MISNTLDPLSIEQLRALYFSRGPFNPPTIAIILSEVGEMLAHLGCPHKLASKTKLVMIEALQNAFLYGFENVLDNSSIEIFREESTYIVSVSNQVGIKKVVALQDALDYIKSLDKKQIEELYINLLGSGGLSGLGGAGLGLLTIAKLSNQNFNYHVAPNGDFASNFKFIIAVS